MKILFAPTWSYPDPTLVTISIAVLIMILVSSIAYRIYKQKRTQKITIS